MNDPSQLSEYEFERVLTPEVIKTFQILQLGLISGVTLFAGVVLFLYTQPVPKIAPDFDMLNVLSFVHAVFVITAYVVSNVMYRKILVRNLAAADNPYTSALTLMRTAMLIRLALLEGSAFFGLVVTITAVTGGAAQQEPAYLLNLLSSVLVLYIGAATFPTKERLKDVFVTYIKKTGN